MHFNWSERVRWQARSKRWGRPEFTFFLYGFENGLLGANVQDEIFTFEIDSEIA
jgi:hypothetical protein